MMKPSWLGKLGKRLGQLPSWAHASAVMLVALLAFAPTLGFDFISYDDPEFVTENPRVNTGLSFDNLKWAFDPRGEANLWNPLSYLSHQLDVSLFGLDPGWHHATNVLWHALAAGLLFLIARKLIQSLGWAYFVALLWALHPQRVQSVAWVSERKDVLSGAFFFASILVFAEWSGRGRKSPALYVGSLACFAAAALAKPSVVPLPLVLIALFAWRPEKPVASVIQALRPIMPFLACAAMVAGLVIHFQSRGTLAAVGDEVSWLEQARLVVMSFAFYPARFLWPLPSRLLFLEPDSAWISVVAFMGLVGFFATAVWLRKRSPMVPLGAAVYVLMWLPISGLIPVSHYFVADRYSYLPQIGLIMMLVGVFRAIALPKPAQTTLLTCLVVAHFVIMQSQLPIWRNSHALFGHEMAVNPKSSMAAIHYGKEFEIQQPETALHYYVRAHQLADAESLPLTQMGLMQLRLGMRDEAFESFSKATRSANPVSEAWNKLLVLQVERRLYAEADDTVRDAVERFPRDWSILMNGGNFRLLVQNSPQTALPLFLQARVLAPDNADTIQAIIRCYRALGQHDKAEQLARLLD